MKTTLVLWMSTAACLAGCADLDNEGTQTQTQELSGAARRPRSEAIRDVAAAHGLTNGVLLAGIAQVETGLSHCWSEATWACQGPTSSFCGGPVIAGASDGPCSQQQGGLGMFQFDGGTYAQTLARDGTAILQLDGNISHAVDFVTGIVIQEVSGVSNRTQALAWMNSIPIVSGNSKFTQWNAILACRYNGACGSATQAAKYRDATLGMFTEFGTGFWSAASTPGSSTPGDVDGDGRADLVTAHSNGNAYVYAGAASGAFGSVAVNFGGTLDSALIDGSGHRLVGVADVTGDGLSDLVSVSSSGTAYVWPGRADRTFGNAAASFNGTMALATATSAGHDPVAVADVDGDGMADLITVHSNGNVYVYHGTSSGNFGGGVANFSGTFQSALRTGVGHWVVGAGDVNGDGRADLVTVHSNGNAYVYLGQADGSFAGTVSSFAGTMHAAVLDGHAGHVPVGVADVDGDGRADLVTVHSNGNAYVYLGHADGSFSGGASSFAGTLAMGQFGGTGHQVIGALDVTGDGRADLVTQRAGTVYVYPGTATGAFGGSTASFAGTLDSSFTDTTGHELVQMGPSARRRACPTTGCRMP